MHLPGQGGVRCRFAAGAGACSESARGVGASHSAVHRSLTPPCTTEVGLPARAKPSTGMNDARSPGRKGDHWEVGRREI